MLLIFFAFLGIFLGLTAVGTGLWVVFWLIRRKLCLLWNCEELSGYGLARSILNHYRLFDIACIRIRGSFCDYFDTGKKILFLSEQSYDGKSVCSLSSASIAAAGVAQIYGARYIRKPQHSCYCSTQTKKMDSPLLSTETQFVCANMPPVSDNTQSTTYNCYSMKKGGHLYRINRLLPTIRYLLKLVMPLSVCGLILGFCGILTILALACTALAAGILGFSIIFSLIVCFEERRAARLAIAYISKMEDLNTMNKEKYKKCPKNKPDFATSGAEWDILKSTLACSPPLLLIDTLLSPIYFFVFLANLR